MMFAKTSPLSPCNIFIFELFRNRNCASTAKRSSNSIDKISLTEVFFEILSSMSPRYVPVSTKDSNFCLFASVTIVRRFKCGGDGCGRLRKVHEGTFIIETMLRASGEIFILRTSNVETSLNLVIAKV